MLLTSCITTFTGKQAIKVNIKGQPVDCSFTVFYEHDKPIKTDSVCSFEVMIGEKIFKCLVKSPTEGKEVNLETDCSAIF